MKSFGYINTKILAMCAAFLAAAAAGALYLSHSARNRDQRMTTSADWCRQAEDCIAEAVYRYQIQNSEGHEETSLFFLSVGQDRDPEKEVIKRLEGDSYRVKPISQSANHHKVIKDKETGEEGVVLRVGNINWVNDTTVEVECSAYSGWGDVKGYVYHPTRGEKRWVVSERKFAFES